MSHKIAPSEHNQRPSSVLIVGSGVFGLSTALALSTRPAFAHTKITLVDRGAFPTADASSIDSSRIVRADYAKREYVKLGRDAEKGWRGEWGQEGRYKDGGLCLVGGGGDGGKDQVGGRKQDKDGEAEGVEYVRKSLANVLALERHDDATEGYAKGGGYQTGDAISTQRKRGIEVLPRREDIGRVMQGGGGTATTGYVNWNSGWADAEASMTYLLHRVQALNRVEFVAGKVKRLLFSTVPSSSSSSSNTASIVTGALFHSGQTLHADLTILAAGAWTPTLLDLRGICSATAQCIAYIPISASEHADLSTLPTLLDMQTGYFFIPPNPREKLLKIARHAFGYANPTTIPHPETPENGVQEIVTSVPLTALDEPNLQIPTADQAGFREALQAMLPPKLKHISTRPFARTRLCWYTDTPTGDFLVDYHPRYNRSLFVATGGSGHAFKFLPAIGERVVDVLEGRKGVGGSEGGMEVGLQGLEELWAWPADWEERRMKAVVEGRGGGAVWTEDGSRGGVRGLLLREALQEGKGNVLGIKL